MRAALDATTVSKCARLMMRVSTSCASGSGAVTRRSGSSGKNTVPSGSASRSPVKRRPASRSRNESSKRRVEASQSSSAALTRRLSRNSTTCASPAAMRKPRLERQLAHEELEGGRFRQAMGEIGLQHRQLIEVREQNAGRRQVWPSHRICASRARDTAGDGGGRSSGRQARSAVLEWLQDGLSRRARHSASRPRTTRRPTRGPWVSVTMVRCPSA